jgi:hypothetical protein
MGPKSSYTFLESGLSMQLNKLIFADFEDTPTPCSAVLDGLTRVIHIGRFSKSISALFAVN